MNIDRLTHLPERKQRELQRVAAILFDEFEEVQKTKLSEKSKRGRILKLILFGSYARGDWVEDRKSGYLSDYDLLVIVNYSHFADQTYEEVNSQLAQGRPFFVDIARDGIVLCELKGYPLASPKSLEPDEARAEAKRHFEQWFPDTTELIAGSKFYQKRGNLNLAAFQLHQATERLYHSVLLVTALYSPKSHKLRFLRSQAERIAPQLVGIWPNDTKFAKRAFARLDRAYVDARYSPAFEITAEELAWLVDSIKALQEAVAAICAERIAS